MKILLLADKAEPKLWEHLDRTRLEGVELVLCAGDLPASYLSFLTCFTNAPILYIRGNHDEKYDVKPPEGCISIDDEVVVFKGVRIVGLGGSMRYRPGECQFTDREMTDRIRSLRRRLRKSKGFDILLAHAPAYGVGDNDDLCHRGFTAFLDMMDKYHPRYMVHGHIHQEYSWKAFRREREYGQTQVINACGSYLLDYPEEFVTRDGKPATFVGNWKRNRELR